MPDNIYCYPNSEILRNKLQIKNKTELLNAEIELTGNRLIELQKKPVNGKFDFQHLCKIHKHIFQDLFEWAGKPRTVDIGKGNLFCLVQHIPSYAASIFGNYYTDCMNAQNDKEQFVHILTEHYADLNALHPFREGNGRSQREFARELCLKCGYIFDLSKTNHQEMLEASIMSFNTGSNQKLENIFQKAITPIEDYKNLKQQLKSTITTLSSDDIPQESSKKDRGKQEEAFGYIGTGNPNDGYEPGK